MIPGFDFETKDVPTHAQNMRGRNVLVMINGISINSTRATSRQFDAIDPFNIDRISSFRSIFYLRRRFYGRNYQHYH
ncbi:Plug domain-containing protein [Chryseobacterium indoltheticum]|uniref:Plug domain-containing protein n=1 Tax=Chryseobacterium indoltheticum TaxID=254 RepID=UPI003F496B83